MLDIDITLMIRFYQKPPSTPAHRRIRIRKRKNGAVAPHCWDFKSAIPLPPFRNILKMIPYRPLLHTMFKFLKRFIDCTFMIRPA